jgi:hypothetical protein
MQINPIEEKIKRPISQPRNGTLNLDPAEIRVFLLCILIFEAPEKKKSIARWEGGLPSCLLNWI